MIETLKTYNGWTNWNTWNVNTWLVNDVYCLSLAMMIKKTSNKLSDFIEIMLPFINNVITDDINIELVNFTEIFENLE